MSAHPGEATPTPATQEEVQPPAGQLGLNPANQYQPDPTPTAANDRSVPDAPVVGAGEREALPQEGESAQPPQPGVNPANQFQGDPTPTAGPDRSVPDAPVVGGAEREALPAAGESPQQAARAAGGAWPPLSAPEAEPK